MTARWRIASLLLTLTLLSGAVWAGHLAHQIGVLPR